MVKYLFISILTTLLLISSQASAETKTMKQTTTSNTMMMQDKEMMKECKDPTTGKWMYDKKECADYKMMKKKSKYYNYGYGRGYYGMHGKWWMHYFVCSITIALTWILMFLGIVALWKYIKKQKK